MDPNTVLELLRREVSRFNEHHDIDHEQRELVDAVSDLDEWLTKGGFLPDAWSRDPVTRAVANRLEGW